MFLLTSLFCNGKKANKKMIFASPEVKEKHLHDTHTAISTLRETMKTQEIREQHIAKKMHEIVVDAKKKMAKGNKKGALCSMKKKKLYEQEVEKIENIKMTLEIQIMNLESSSQNAFNVHAMKEGTKALQAIRANCSIDQVENLMEDIREETENARDIDNALRVPIEPDVAFSDDDLLKELDALDKLSSSSDEITLKTESSTYSSLNAESLLLPSPFPSSPSSLPILQKEKDEMKRLEAELMGL